MYGVPLRPRARAGWRRRGRQGVVLAAVLLGAVAAWWLWPSPGYAFLVVDEANGRAPREGWTAGVESAAWWDGEGNLRVVRGAVRPWHRLVCLHEVDAAGVLVESRLTGARHLPARLDLARPVQAMAEGARVLAGPLEVLGVDAAGSLHLRYGGQAFTLAPGQSWACLGVRDGAGERWFSPSDAPAWEAAVEEALASGEAVTRLVVTYRGRWRHGRVAPGAGVLPGRPGGRG